MVQREPSSATTRAEDTEDLPILELDALRTWFFTDEGIVRAVDGVSFRVKRGESVGVVGESGSGKSVMGLSIMRLLDEPGRIVDGSIRFRGTNLVALKDGELRKLRGKSVTMVFQDPMTSLNPVLKIARQMREAIMVHSRIGKHQAEARSARLLQRMGISEAERALKSYPHQFSGGMRQRVMIAMGFGNEPSMLIADEPTTALDVTVQAEIIDLLHDLNRDTGTSILMITHDLGVVAALCTRVVVMYGGQVVEDGPADQILSTPRHPYTRTLINAVPRIDRPRAPDRRLTVIEGQPPDPRVQIDGCRFAPRCPYKIERCSEDPPLNEVAPGHLAACWVGQAGELLPAVGNAPISASATPRDAEQPLPRDTASTPPILELEGITKHYRLPAAWPFSPRLTLRAADGVDLIVRQGETVGLVGESGSGKSTIARLALRLQNATAGRVKFDGQDITSLPRNRLHPLRRHMQMLFQDPYSSLNPRMTVGQAIGEVLRFHGLAGNSRESRERVAETLAQVGLSDSGMIDRYPHEFSGGQRQRIGIARCLVLEPRLIIADEPVSALDVNIQAQIINLMVDLQERLNLTYIFIAHDLAVVRHFTDRIVVLYLGKVMEVASNAALFEQPLHPYTKILISAAPVPDSTMQSKRQRLRAIGEIPSPVNPPSGCRFRTRCPIARPYCAEHVPELEESRPGRLVACHFPGEL